MSNNKPAPKYQPKTSLNREEWLKSAMSELSVIFREQGYEVPEKIRVTVGWPSKGGLAVKKRRIGEAWDPACSGDRHAEIFISPWLEDGVKVLGILLHEMIHATVGNIHGHKKPFKECMKKVGLEGKATATTEGEDLVKRLKVILGRLGTFPHFKLEGRLNSGAPKQTTRLLLAECPKGHKVRMSAKVMDEAGLPTCGCGLPMLSDHDDTDEGGDDGE